VKRWLNSKPEQARVNSWRRLRQWQMLAVR